MRSLRFLPLTVPRLGRKPARGAGAWDFETIPNSLGPPIPATTKRLSPDSLARSILPYSFPVLVRNRGPLPRQDGSKLPLHRWSSDTAVLKKKRRVDSPVSSAGLWQPWQPQAAGLPG